MRQNRLKRKLLTGEVGVGLILLSPDPHLTCVAAEAGYDYVMPDLEHTAVSLRELEGLVRAAEAAGIDCVARVPGTAKRDILPVLELGVSGIMAPAVESPAEAESLAAASRYYPEGRRGIYYQSPVSRYGTVPARDHLEQANRELLVIAQIETEAGVAHATEIAAVPGIDCLLVGPGDLSQSLGNPFAFDDPRLWEATTAAFQAALAAGKIAGIMPAGMEHAARCRAAGALLMIAGPDIGLFRSAAEADVAQWHSAVGWEPRGSGDPG